jgi:hypothetical protein
MTDDKSGNDAADSTGKVMANKSTYASYCRNGFCQEKSVCVVCGCCVKHCGCGDKR